MPPQYLTTAFKDRDEVKALGARFDGALKKWYVPEGRDVTPFAPWLPGDALAPGPAASTDLAPSARRPPGLPCRAKGCRCRSW